MKAYYISDTFVIDRGDGPENTTAVKEALIARKLATGADFTHSLVMPTDPQTGQPLHNWALEIVGTKDHAILRGKQKIDPCPDYPLDAKLSSMEVATKEHWKGQMQRRGISLANLQETNGYRVWLRQVGRQLDPTFDEAAFDTADVSV